MTEKLIYQERLSSKRTQALFASLALLFFGILFWRVMAARSDFWDAIFLDLFFFFLFSFFNYRALLINLSEKTFSLTFGLFTWRIPLHNIAACRLDELPALLKWGGAGIHFYLFQKRNRASFNFLEYPHVSLTFHRKVGPVSEVSFSTRNPEEIIALLQNIALSKEK